MNRRQLLAGAATAALPSVAAPAGAASKPTDSAARMKAGMQHFHSDDWLQLLSSLGVTHICSGLPSPRMDENWSADGLKRLRDRVESFGIRLEAVPLPMSSAYITRAEMPHIILGRDPQRDEEIGQICQMIRNAARAGIPMLKYNFNILGVPRTAPTAGRGAARYSTFVYDEAQQKPPLTEAGPVSEELAWNRIEYFLKRVVPVAEEHRVKIACHPHDPGMPRDRGFRGVHRVLGHVDGLKRFVATVPSPYHGLNFCQGTVSEMLEKPGEQIYDVIRYFGKRGKIFNVHFRNIKGGFLKFQESFPDDGDVDMLKAIRTYRDVGYTGMIMPDHAPSIPGDTGSKQSFAFEIGYIQAALQHAYSE